MFQWIHGRPPVLARMADVGAWRAGSVPAEPGRPVTLVPHRGSTALALGGTPLTTAVPLELGGMLLVGAVYCDSDQALSAHLDLTPSVGWDLVPERIFSDGTGHALFDGGRDGSELVGPNVSAKVRAESGGIVPVSLERGTYEIETLGPWAPDDRTEVFLVRLLRAGRDSSP